MLTFFLSDASFACEGKAKQWSPSPDWMQLSVAKLKLHKLVLDLAAPMISSSLSCSFTSFQLNFQNKQGLSSLVFQWKWFCLCERIQWYLSHYCSSFSIVRSACGTVNGTVDSNYMTALWMGILKATSITGTTWVCLDAFSELTFKKYLSTTIPQQPMTGLFNWDQKNRLGLTNKKKNPDEKWCQSFQDPGILRYLSCSCHVYVFCSFCCWFENFFLLHVL